MKFDLLMVDPKCFDVIYSINPWMDVMVPVDKELMLKQWQGVYSRLIANGLKVDVHEPIQGLPDMVFAANAGMIHSGKAIVSKFRDDERAGEEPYFSKWYKDNGYEVFTLSDGSIWEGQACSVFMGEDLLCSYTDGGRANHKAYQEISTIWGLSKEKMKFVELRDPYFYHLDVSLCILDESTVMLCPLAFMKEDYDWIKSKYRRVIEVSYDDALNFGCNAFVFRNTIFLSSSISNELEEKLTLSGYSLEKCDVSEFIKAGGGVKCLIFKP